MGLPGVQGTGGSSGTSGVGSPGTSGSSGSSGTSGSSGAGTISGGANGKVAFFTGATTLSSNTNFHWDNTNSWLGIGTTNPSQVLHVVGDINATVGFRINNGATAGTYLRGNGTRFVVASLNADDLGAGTVANAKLANSTISGVALGNNLNTLTMNTSGIGLAGSTTYNGSGATTFTVTSNATNANTASTIVARDASGNFNAGTISAALNGTATNATNINTETRTTNESGHLVFIGTTATGNVKPYTNTTLRVNPSTNTITATTFSGALNGNATTATTATNITATSNTTLTTLSNLVSIGTITTGTWNASTIAVNRGGTGATTLAANKLLIGNDTFAVFTNSNLHWDNTNSRLGIGATSPAEKLHVAGNIYIGNGNQFIRYRSATIWDYYLSATNDDFFFYDSQNTNFFEARYNGGGTGKYFRILNTLFVSNSGNVGIGTTSPGSNRLQVDGATRVTSLGVNTNDTTTGQISATANIIAYSSDKRLKTDIAPLHDALQQIQHLSGFTYRWNDIAHDLAGFDTERRQVGVFAQDVQAVQPEAVHLAPFDNDGYNNSISGERYLTVQYDRLVPLLVEAIKELSAKVDRLKNVVDGE
jgi:hypothetical protein